MPNQASDESVLDRIRGLVEEEKTLLSGSRTPDGERLSAVQVELDQCWDLLRQRRALREFGDDPDEARVRPAEVVENYEQ